MTSEALQTKVFADLNALGFTPAKSLPLPDLEAKLRPVGEIAGRLMALDALVTWVVFTEEDASTERVEQYIERNELWGWLTEEETEIIETPRAEANAAHSGTIGWKLENMWALAWVLGFDLEPDLEAAQIPDKVTRHMIYDFLPGLGATVEQLVAKSTPRTTSEVIAMGYRFYAAHNAVRSAQLGGDTVPAGFHPIMHGGAVHERRHSLSWCLTPGVDWDDTDLST